MPVATLRVSLDAETPNGAFRDWTCNSGADHGDYGAPTVSKGMLAFAINKKESYYAHDDSITLPAAASISSVSIGCVKTDAVGTAGSLKLFFYNGSSTQQESTAFSSTGTHTYALALNPFTGLAWTRADVFATQYGMNSITIGSGGSINVLSTGATYGFSISVSYTMPTPWSLALPTMTLYTMSLAQPTDYTLLFDIFSGGVLYPAGTTFSWSAAAAPTDKGWWVSSDIFAGVGYIVDSTSRPKAPRGFTELVAFATGANLWACGTPCTVFNNHLVYAEGGYTVGTTSPVIRIYDGVTDRSIASLPNTSAGVVPKAITAMLTANGVVYIATLDTGSSSADWVGRIFSLNIESGQLTPIGAAITTGHIPYALCWHAGRLWCGTHRQNTAASGKIFSIHPGIDSDWTADYDLATSTVSSATSLLSFQGKLYVGTNNAAAAFAKVLVRDTAGTYTTSLTLSGGAATAGNGVPALVEFSSALYASYYNADTPVISSIRKYDGSSWSTAYTGSGTTLVPFIGFPTDGTKLLAIAGGVGIVAALIKTADGTTWTDQSVYLQQSTTSSAGLSAFGTVVH